MQRRIFVSSPNSGLPHLPWAAQASGRGRPLTVRRVVSWGRSSTLFLRKAPACYLGRGSHPGMRPPNATIGASSRRQGRRADPGRHAGRRERRTGRREASAGTLACSRKTPTGRNSSAPAELPGGQAGEFSRIADILPAVCDAAVDLRCGPVLQTPRGARCTPVPARRAHSGRAVQRHHPGPADHQHPRAPQADDSATAAYT